VHLARSTPGSFSCSLQATAIESNFVYHEQRAMSNKNQTCLIGAISCAQDFLPLKTSAHGATLLQEIRTAGQTSLKIYFVDGENADSYSLLLVHVSVPYNQLQSKHMFAILYQVYSNFARCHFAPITNSIQ
jgi:hypothetical protein